jgi:hypothetical protein
VSEGNLQVIKGQLLPEAQGIPDGFDLAFFAAEASLDYVIVDDIGGEGDLVFLRDDGLARVLAGR